jgi:Protein of unknown function (DUF2851)
LPQEETIMREELLHFIWRFRYFNHHELLTEAGQAVWIHATGEPNVNQGPDFLHARISIGGTLHEGPVELHIKTSDWHRHAHDADSHYRQVVLHVVWENDLEDPPGGVPVLALGHRIPKLLLGRYRQWMDSQAFIPCERRLPVVDAATRTAWLQQLVKRRLQQRALFIAGCLEANCQHWEETTWWLMARSMGQPVNAAAFEAIARSLPVRLLLRQREDPARLEALLLKQAGSLKVPLSFLRMRPPHFPTVRLAQLAGLIARHSGWFGTIRDAESPRDLDAPLEVTAAGYRMGDMIKKSLLINAFIPLLFAYGWLRGLPAYQEKALRWLAETRPEDNAILRGWRRLGVPVKNAADSQALLELKNNYCNNRKCLDCAIGQHLLGQGREPVTESPAPGSN